MKPNSLQRSGGRSATSPRPRTGAAAIGVCAFVIATFAAAASSGCASTSSGQSDLASKLSQPMTRDLQQARRLAIKAQRAKDEETAIKRYQEALALYPEFAPAWNNLGAMLIEQSRYLEAANAFTQASQFSPSDPRPMYNLALTWDRAGYYDDALEFYNLALERDARYLPALRGSIRAEQRLNRGDERTLGRLRKAIGLERDTKWREYLVLQRSRVEQIVDRYAGSMKALSSVLEASQAPADQ